MSFALNPQIDICREQSAFAGILANKDSSLPPLPLIVWQIPLRTSFRSINERAGMLLGGPQGWAEFSPFKNYDPAQSVPWLQAALEAAYIDAPTAQRNKIAVNATVPACPAVEAAKWAKNGGCATVKVKVAAKDQDIADDIERLQAVRRAVGHEAQIRIDVNAAWTLEEAANNIPLLDAAAGGLQYVEQPCRTVDELVQLRQKIRVPLAADESIRLAHQAQEVAQKHAAQVAILKLQPLGGYQAICELLTQIESYPELKFVLSSAVETSVGLQMAARAAAALPQIDLACGLGTLGLLTTDVAGNYSAVKDGFIPVGTPEVFTDDMSRWAASESEKSYWLERLRLVLKELPHGRFALTGVPAGGWKLYRN